MSRAFVKESEGEWLYDVAPDTSALGRFLTHEYGEKIYLVRTTRDGAELGAGTPPPARYCCRAPNARRIAAQKIVAGATAIARHAA